MAADGAEEDADDGSTSCLLALGSLALVLRVKKIDEVPALSSLFVLWGDSDHTNGNRQPLCS